MDEVLFDDFKKLDIRVGKVVDAESIEGSEKLLKLKVDFGNEMRQAVAGIAKHYKPEELKNRKFVFVVNLKPVKLMGIESNCMICAADDGKGNIVVLTPEKDVESGSWIR